MDKKNYLDEKLYNETQEILDETEELLDKPKDLPDHVCPECGNEIFFGVVYDTEDNDCEVEKGHDPDCRHMDI